MADAEEDSREGRAARDLFRTDSDSTESDEDDHLAAATTTIGGLADTATTAAQSADATTTVLRRILDVELEEQTIGGSIEHRLWPAAAYLATFILEQSRIPPLQNNVDVDPSATCMQALRRLLQCESCDIVQDGAAGIRILELGAGIGLTGIALAMQLPLPARIVVTDLESALPLLRANVARNTPLPICNTTTIHVQALEWGNPTHIAAALAATRITRCNNAAHDTGTSLNSDQNQPPLLILGSDCVYWESLYQPLEITIATLLQNSPPNSLCLLAGMRRWKRDNHFYQYVLGKSTRTPLGRLECVQIDEQVQRIPKTISVSIETNASDLERQVMRIYAVRWIQR
jgi:Lysine methyltransferase